MKRVFAQVVRRRCNIDIIAIRRNITQRTTLCRSFTAGNSRKELRSSETNTATFHKRQLPSSLVAMSSSTGKQLFREALAVGGMESFFPLSEQFVTQSEPSFCALSTLAMVLNALNYDPGKTWKGPWRWISEETLQCDSQHVCGHSLERVKKHGMNFSEFESLARCHGVRIRSHRVHHCADNDETTSSVQGLAEFREHIRLTSSSSTGDVFVVVNFGRKALGQTGGGHFSPIGGFHAEKDLALIMDVARFKYPPFWVPIVDLWRSMSFLDDITGEARGYFIITSWDQKSHTRDSTSCTHHDHDCSTAHASNLLRASCPPQIRTWVDYSARKQSKPR